MKNPWSVFPLSNMQNDSILFTPIKIGSIKIPNRFVRSATNAYAADKDGFVTDKLVAIHENLARGEVGLILTGHTYVLPEGKAGPRQLGIYSNQMLEGLSRIPESVHRCPSKVFLQISHAGRQTKEKLCGSIPKAPSAVYEPTFKVTPEEMSENDIQTVIQAFIKSAKRAREAGFDGVQLHIAHGYLLSSFISPHTNRRTDQWGGSLQNRIRIILEIIKGIRSGKGPSFPLIVKLNSDDFIPGGLKIGESIPIARILEKQGIDAIEVSGGIAESDKGSVWKGVRTEKNEGYFLNHAAQIKSAVHIPVFGLGGFRTFTVMEKTLTERKADLVSMSRPFIREPDLVKKFRNGTAKKAACISCNLCFNPRGIKCGAIKRNS